MVSNKEQKAPKKILGADPLFFSPPPPPPLSIIPGSALEVKLVPVQQIQICVQVQNTKLITLF